jgi:hypothetical protein
MSPVGSPPADTDLVQSALRLGWVVAEVRGRNRPGGPQGEVVRLPPAVNDPLPLGIERTLTEMRIQAQSVMAELAKKLQVDTFDGDLCSEVDEAAHDLYRARKGGFPSALPGGTSPEQDAWERLSEAIWRLDAHVQDRLAARSDTQRSGYQLGRGLAENYWALDRSAADGWDSWPFLFGPRRHSELNRLVGRLAAYAHDLAAAAISGSLEVWRVVAADDQWRRQPSILGDLYQQTRDWYGLLVLGQDPTRLVKPYDLLQNWRLTRRAFRLFLPQLVETALGVAALFGLVWVVSTKHPASWLAYVLSLLGALGLGAAGLTTMLKNQAQTLWTRLRQDAYTDLVAVSICRAPSPPRGRSRRAELERIVAQRELTPSTPPA